MDKILLRELKKNKQVIQFLRLKKIIDNNNSELSLTYNILNDKLVHYILVNVFKHFINEQGNITYHDMTTEATKQGKEINFSSLPSVLSSSFTWGKTLQGRSFWRNLHLKWVKYLADNVIKIITNEQVANRFYTQHTFGY